MIKILYNHFPKCAGSSCTAWLKRYFSHSVCWESAGEDSLESLKEFHKLNPVEKNNIQLITGHCTCELLPFLKGFMTTTTLREPVAREVSLHAYYTRLGHTTLPLEDWVETDCFPRYPSLLELLETYHIIGFQENLQPFCWEVIKSTGFNMTNFPKLNVSPDRDLLNSVDTTLRNRIVEMVGEDFETYRRLKEMFFTAYS